MDAFGLGTLSVWVHHTCPTPHCKYGKLLIGSWIPDKGPVHVNKRNSKKKLNNGQLKKVIP